MNRSKRARLEARGWRVGSSEEFLQAEPGGDEGPAVAAGVVGLSASPNDRNKRRDRSIARTLPHAQINSDPWLSALTDAIVKRGRDIAVATITKRFASSGIRLNRREQLAFEEFFAGKGPSPTIRRRRRTGRAQAVALSPKEIRDFNRRLRRLVKVGAKSVPGLAEDVAVDTLKRFKRRWPKQEREQRQSLMGFGGRLQKRWGGPLSQFNLLITLAREFGARTGACVRLNGVKTPWLCEVLTRLHARACQIAMEVHTLLSSGLADGAMARSRTLHEIAATAFFVQEHGEDTAERYVLHDAIESWRAAREYNRHAATLKMRRYGKREMDRLGTLRSRLLDRFGKSFDGHYGWASHILKPESTDPVRSFSDIEECVMPHLRPYYQLASHKVHAKSKGIYSQLGAMGDREVLLAGASNAGLADPGQDAALFLFQVTTVLGLLHASFETTMMMKLMSKLEREIGAGFVRAHDQLIKDERRRQRVVRRGRGAGR